MHLEFLVEEPSAVPALRNLVPRIVPDTEFDIQVHGGKGDLLDSLPGRLRGYRHWLPADWRIVVLLDEDRADCRALKKSLEEAQRAGLLTRTSAAGHPYQVLNRIAVEELEAWFFGDVAAIIAAYPGVPPSLGRQEKYRNPDQISGGTWEALERVLQHAGHFGTGLLKTEAAREISRHMDPDRNTSRSFRLFRDGLRELIQPQPAAAAPPTQPTPAPPAKKPRRKKKR